jgi:predicted hydrocarbon binding protein
MGAISQEILEELYTILEGIIGPRGVKLLQRRIEEKGLKDIPQIIFEIAGEMENLFGSKGAFATLREVGRQVAKNLMEHHPKEEWEKVFKEGLRVTGFAQGVERDGNRACICSCIFYPNFLSKKGLKPTEHAVCWIGWGFIEGFMKAFTGAIGVRFVERDFEKNQCWFGLIRDI